MREKYYPPKKGENQFHCIHCNVYAQQHWQRLCGHFGSTAMTHSNFSASKCEHCGAYAFWHQDRMIVPEEAPVEPVHPDLPTDCQLEYNEARAVFARSPRAAAALLRLCIQKLMPHLGQKGKNINDDIASLVANGLPQLVQQALDFCRVVGNNAVHPGEIKINDTPDIAQQLFRMINFIVEDRISRPKEIAELYSQLPQPALDAIQKRDQGKLDPK